MPISSITFRFYHPSLNREAALTNRGNSTISKIVTKVAEEVIARPGGTIGKSIVVDRPIAKLPPIKLDPVMPEPVVAHPSKHTMATILKPVNELV